MASAVAALAVWPSFMVQKAPAASFTPRRLCAITLWRSIRGFLRAASSRGSRRPDQDADARATVPRPLPRTVRHGRYRARPRTWRGDRSNFNRKEIRRRRCRWRAPCSPITTSAARWCTNAPRGSASRSIKTPSRRWPRSKWNSADTMAKKMLDGITSGIARDPTVDSVRARYAELTGDLPRARSSIAARQRSMDSGSTIPPTIARGIHFRAAQLAYEAGDFGASRAVRHIACDVSGQRARADVGSEDVPLRKTMDEFLTAATRAAASIPCRKHWDMKPTPNALSGDRRSAADRRSDRRRTEAL